MTAGTAVEAGASTAEEDAMRRAIELAATALGRTSPNPVVGCVLLGPTGRPVGEGFHRGAGHMHAETEALATAGSRARGGTAVVTLEPCAHQGRTGPCADALLSAGVARVVYAVPDPDPVATGGAQKLLAAGVSVAAWSAARGGGAGKRTVAHRGPAGPAVRHLEVRRVARRPLGGAGRHLPLDHRK